MEEDIQNYNQSINKHGQPQKYASFDLQGTMNATKRPLNKLNTIVSEVSSLVSNPYV